MTNYHSSLSRIRPMLLTLTIAAVASIASHLPRLGRQKTLSANDLGGQSMALLQWSENLSVGVVEMDRQHQKLVELVNRLYQAMGEGKGDNLKKEILT